MTSFAELPYQVTLVGDDDTAITFDCTLTENHSDSVTVTEHPVESGANVADHAQREMASLTLNGIISNQPIVLDPDNNLEPSVSGGDPDRRAEQAYAEFLRLQAAYVLFTVSTEFRTYENMMITGVAVARDKSRRFILDIGLTLREYRKATLESVDAPEPTEPVHKTKRKQGRKQSDEPSTEVEEKAESALESAANALEKIRGAGGLF